LDSAARSSSQLPSQPPVWYGPGMKNLLTQRVAAASASLPSIRVRDMCGGVRRDVGAASSGRRGPLQRLAGLFRLGGPPATAGWTPGTTSGTHPSVAYAVYGDRLDGGRNKKVHKGARRPYDRPKFPSCQRSARGKKRTSRGRASLDRSTIIFSSSPASNHLQNTIF
jgi:hypothetical protein